MRLVPLRRLLSCLLALGPALLLTGAASSPPAGRDEAFAPADPLDAPQLEAALAGLAPQRPGVSDLFVLGFAGDGSDPVFRNEVLYLRTLFSERFDSRGHALALVNAADNFGAHRYAPMATYDNLYDSLARIGALMDREEDILLLFASTHGTEDHALYVDTGPYGYDYLTPEDLRQALDDAGIKHRVIVLSACYSGGFIPRLRSADTLVITAARADRPSFGCGNTANATYFGQAWLVDAMNRTDDFVEAYRLASTAITARERAEGELPSLPQISQGKRIGATLAHWRAGLHAGPAVPYPYPPVDDAAAAPHP
ncbi:C13 family peptidase [Stenotrophomonas sp. HITSZ_GD]|uniref:C13 family peptidase n=1 Tax=Stenotrophomonas sp. HITSZ_GD TaxID=3037248 RepID=UPI00240D0E1B|nr:C13 family peptidase [Stenotrophomonas sp. HITSZ_GD]MDG2526656.1 C13 family peptidase [Stenotrophomonas sp. HITSZ_GD]